jgi:hypothetical protein
MTQDTERLAWQMVVYEQAALAAIAERDAPRAQALVEAREKIADERYKLMRRSWSPAIPPMSEPVT